MSKTLNEYISQVSSDFFNLRKTSIVRKEGNFEYLHSISLESYMEIIRSNAILVTLPPEDVAKYKYKPRLLSRVLYGTENLYYLLLLLNDMTVETFVPEEIYLLNRSDRSIIETIINKERSQGTL